MTLRGTNQELGRPFNRRTVLELIRRHGPVARNEIADRTGLTVQTISNIVRELEEDGFLISSRRKPSGRGLPPSTLSINPDSGHAFGIQITPLAVEVSLVNLGGTIVTTTREETENANPELAFGIIARLVEHLKAQFRDARLLGAGLAMPGPFGVDSMSFIGPTTLAGWQDVNIPQQLEKATGLPSFIEIDMAAAALGEQLYGHGTNLSDYYYLYFGLGLGGTMVHDGETVRGNWGNAGEIGHLTVLPDGEMCPCGNRGCLERYVSLEAFGRRRMGEAEWVEDVRPIFTRAIRMIENMYDPQTIVLGGLASRSLLTRLAETADALGNSIAARHDRTVPRLMVAALGDDTVLRGAAALAVRGALAPREGRMFKHPPSQDQWKGAPHGPASVGA
ncbi:MAG: ROK family protein [Rhizobiales bacterium]|nr:ROK family protein [Hyphomicrobiales bacterium]